MTPDLQRRLERSIAPFDGMCIHDVDGLSLPELRTFLELAVSWLRPRYPNIRSFRDWYEHDGFVVESKTGWNPLIAATANQQTLLDSRDEDWQVGIAWYPTEFHWLHLVFLCAKTMPA
ncbi:MAG: hypothetical protein ACTHK7_20880 [Aureliella sp.]